MLRTQGNLSMRSEYDFSEAVSNFRESADPALCAWVKQRFLRAEAVIKAVQGLAMPKPTEAVEVRDKVVAQVAAESISSSIDDLIDSTWRKMATLDGSFLRLL